MVMVFKKIMLITALLITIFIFLAGFYAGFLIDNFRIGDADNIIVDSELDTDSFIVEKDFFDTFASRDCDVLMNRMQVLGDSFSEIGNTLARYDTRSISQSEEYNKLRRKYFLLEIRAYTLRKQMSEFCPNSFSNVILFFYDIKDNQDSLNQGYALDTIVNQRNDLVIFSIDKDFDDNAVRTLVNYYNVSVAPTMILNFEDKFESYVPTGVLRQKLIS